MRRSKRHSSPRTPRPQTKLVWKQILVRRSPSVNCPSLLNLGVVVVPVVDQTIPVQPNLLSVSIFKPSGMTPKLNSPPTISATHIKRLTSMPLWMRFYLGMSLGFPHLLTLHVLSTRH